eukprot:Hpha_TRINITY_DN3975_c0_g1::TRINITY_DN3975_c0_g1_i1::g.17998::m.17998
MVVRGLLGASRCVPFSNLPSPLHRPPRTLTCPLTLLRHTGLARHLPPHHPLTCPPTPRQPRLPSLLLTHPCRHPRFLHKARGHSRPPAKRPPRVRPLHRLLGRHPHPGQSRGPSLPAQDPSPSPRYPPRAHHRAPLGRLPPAQGQLPLWPPSHLPQVEPPPLSRTRPHPEGVVSVRRQGQAVAAAPPRSQLPPHLPPQLPKLVVLHLLFEGRPPYPEGGVAQPRCRLPPHLPPPLPKLVVPLPLSEGRPPPAPDSRQFDLVPEPRDLSPPVCIQLILCATHKKKANGVSRPRASFLVSFR